jgi:hypothetical protein
MGFNLQLLFTGIGVGSIYALVALGFVLGPVDIQLNHASAAARCSMAANDVAVFS